MRAPGTSHPQLQERYSRAVGLTAPKIAARTPGSWVEGYWVDDESFFFLTGKFDPTLGRVIAVPALAAPGSQRVRQLIDLPLLAQQLSAATSHSIDLTALSAASFDLPDRDTLAVSVQNRDCLIDLSGRRAIDVRPAFPTPALYSPDGRYGCFVKGHDLWLRERKTGQERPLTVGGLAHHTWGQQSEAELSTVAYRRDPAPVGLWSPDSQWFLTHRVDERSFPEMGLVQHAPPGGGRPALHRFRHPIPADDLPMAVYAAIHVRSGRTVSFDACPAPVSAYSTFPYRLVWFGDRDTAWWLRRDRYCRKIELVELNLLHGTHRVALEETTASGYLDVRPIVMGAPNVRTLCATSEVIWYSERDGYGHLYLHDAATGELKNRITAGAWIVRDIVHVDEERRRVLFLAGGVDPKADPARRVLCCVGLDGKGFEALLSHDGDIFIPATEPAGLPQERPYRPSSAPPGVTPDGRFCLARYGSVEHGNRTEIVDLQAPARASVLVLAATVPSPDEIPPRHFTAMAADGETPLHGVLFVPPDFSDGRRYPLIAYLYPGPQLAHQPQSYRAVNAAPAMALAQLGFVTLMLDTRGTPVGSRAFHQVGYPELLEPQLADHAAVVRQLCEQHSFIDSARIGVLGHSAGGAAAARALFDYGDLFKVGVSVCGLHAPELQLATWSDKYRGPREGSDRGQANTRVAHKLEGHLLLISGDMDESVHLSQTLLLADALIAANRDFDLLIVPNAGHLLMMTSGYAQRRVWDYFVRHLLDETPPGGLEIRFEPHELAHFAARYTREFA